MDKIGAHPDDPVGENPCPEGHPAYKVWEDATEIALEDHFRLNQKMLEVCPETPEKLVAWTIELTFRRFEIWAKRNVSIVRNRAAVRGYEQWLDTYMEACIKTVTNRFASAEPELRSQMVLRASYWKGNAYRQVRSVNKQHQVDHPGEAAKNALAAHASAKSSNLDSGPPKGDEHSRKNRRGDPALLAGKRLVSLATAEEYLGIRDRQRQKLTVAGVLEVEGKGLNRKITTESLKAYLPAENPN